jgi:hypothetical protein
MRSAGIGLLLLLAACGPASGGEARFYELIAKNDSGVSGSVTLTPVGDDRTRVVVDVDPAGHPDMPAHIHPGTCAEPVPQPKYPLENVRDGSSTTEVPASLDDLLADTVSINLHQSNDHMEISTACVDLD